MNRANAIDLSSQPNSFVEEIKLTANLGWPIVLSNLTQISLPIIDGVMVGSIHSNQLAAASLVINLISIPVLLCMGLTMAISPLVSASLGKSDYKSPLEILVNGMFIGGIFSLLLALIFHFGKEVVFHLGQDLEVARIAQDYLVIIAWRLVPFALFSSISRFAQGLGHTRVVMTLNLITIPLNILLNYILIFGHWGMPALELKGAGYGTLLTQLIALILFIVMILRSDRFGDYRNDLSQTFRIKLSRIKEIIKIGVPVGIQLSLESGAFAFSGLMAGWLGVQQQAAHQIGIYISSLTYVVSIGICTAGSIRVAFFFGKKDWDSVFAIGRSTVFLALIFGLIFSVLLIAGYVNIPFLFTKDWDVIQFAKIVLLMTALFQLSDALQATSAGILRGIQDVKIPTYLSLIAYWVIGIPAGYLFAFTMGWGISGLWTGLILGLSFNALLLTIRFFRKVGQLRIESELA
ncbi:MATE family efflux transporter [Algoriphagus sp. AK58]|uniref:MATE family efflux transporter n=1 Tax=Algoriphagus sp. AK58 TaxID=1406877 RepID=UPI001650370C|nr:MATE family efflux transporter [Algoriphagus sp. AK58]MBC6367515.1 MATE family efflux transporter [Algoriphagus sp. AK58]